VNKHANFTDDGGFNYRDVASIMNELGFQMGHSSVRNYVVRIMTKFVNEFSKFYDVKLTHDEKHKLAMNPAFQVAISNLLQKVEGERRLASNV